jgi:hypothetical protein
MAYVGILEEAIEDLKKEVRFIDVLGPVNLGNKTGVTVRLIIGSSKYTPSEFNRLIDGTIEDCKEQGIETIPPHELQRLKEEYERSYKNERDRI